MKLNRVSKKITSLLLAAAVVATSISLPNVEVSAETGAVGTQNGDIVTFKANLFDYDRDTVNKGTIDMVAAQLKNDNVKTDVDTNKYNALIFKNGAYTVGDYSVNYYDAWDWWNDKSVSASNFLYTYGNNCTYGEGSTGLVDSKLGDNGLPVFNYYVADLFNAEDASNKSVYSDSTVDFVYQDGYYVLDSSTYKYRFDSSKKALNKVDGTDDGFWPFNTSSSKNYFFGMNLSVDFLMTKDGTYNNQDCVFSFSGDDDVWVYIDNTLALDLGGIHEKIGGTIDFKNQVITYVDKNESVKKTVSFADVGLSVNDNKSHTLQVFYLERGAGESNCKIKFNMPTINESVIGDFSFAKVNGTNAPLKGAEFTLYSDAECKNVIGTGTSNNQGVIEFKDLQTGTYYMKETLAPEGYSANDTTYKVILAGNSSDAIASTIIEMNETEAAISNAVTIDGKQYTAIVNKKAEDNIELDKTATLVDWSSRTYEIKLDASASYEKITRTETEETEIEQVNEPVDVILVLDRSGSMNDTVYYYATYSGTLEKKKTYYFYSTGGVLCTLKYSNKEWTYKNDNMKKREKVTFDGNDIYYGGEKVEQLYIQESKTRKAVLLESANAFIDSLNPNSRVGVVQFNLSASTLVNVTELTNQDDKDALKAEIAKIYCNSGTRPDYGMEAAKKMYDASYANSDRKKYVVLVTDGEPDDYDDSINADYCDKRMNGTTGAVTYLKNKGVTVFTVGVDISSNEEAKKMLRNTASYKTESEEKHFYDAGSDNLKSVFEEIATEIKSEKKKVVNEEVETTYYTGKVIDVLDSRFSLTEDAKTSLKNEGATISEDGRTITWDSVKLENWTSSFTVVANAEYAGGNVVTTNTPDSGIIIEGETKLEKFPQPTVNVKLALTAGNAEDTIFLGQSLTKYFTQDQLNKLFAETAERYSDVNLSYKWTEAGVTKTGTLKEFQDYVQKQSPTVTTDYPLTITASPKVADDSKEAQDTASAMKKDQTLYTASMQSAESDATSVTATGTYTVKIIDGQIVLTKKFTGTTLAKLGYTDDEIAKIDARQSAIFTVYRYAEGTSVSDITSNKAKAIESYRLTITGDGSQTIKGLPAGVYQVKEETSWSWKYANTMIEEDKASNEDGIFYIGQTVSYENGENAYSTSKSMNVSMTNEIIEKFEKIYSDTTNVLNKFKMGRQ